MLKIWPFVLALGVLVTGCAGHGTWSTDPIFLTEPDLVLSKRADLTLHAPLLIAIADEQQGEGADDYARARNGTYAARLTAAIVSAYPNAVRAADGSEQSGKVSIRIRIRRLGAYVNRSGQTSMLGTIDPTGGDLGGWGMVVAAAADSEPTISGTRYRFVPNNWSGVANLDVAVTDPNPAWPARFHFPVVAERVVENDYGALRATAIADRAWDNVGPRLARFLDAAVGKLVADEKARMQ